MITNIVLLWVLYEMNAPLWTFALLIVHTAFKLFKNQQIKNEFDWVNPNLKNTKQRSKLNKRKDINSLMR